MTVHFHNSKIAAMLVSGVALIACAPQTGAIEPTPGPALWRVSDADTTVYLYGVPNMMDADTEWRNAAFDSALSDADSVILEADRTSPEAQAMMQQAAPQIGVYRDGRTLTGVLDDETRARAERVAGSLGVPLQALDPLKPWLAANQLQAVMVQRDGLTNPQTPMAVIASEAAEAGKPVAYFEEPTALIAAIGGLPEDSQIRMFEQALDIIENDPEQPARILTQWAEGDVDGLAEAFHGEGEWPDETVRSVMLLERNAAWLAQLEEILETQSGVYFVAAGAGHFVGDDSLVAALDAAGYETARQ